MPKSKRQVKKDPTKAKSDAARRQGLSTFDDG
jgi:hypothetical protein